MTELKPTTFERSQILCLFDVDGTLTPSRMVFFFFFQIVKNEKKKKHITQDMKDLLKRVREKSSIAIVGGSNFVKQKEQLGDSGMNLYSLFSLLKFFFFKKYNDKSWMILIMFLVRMDWFLGEEDIKFMFKLKFYI